MLQRIAEGDCIIAEFREYPAYIERRPQKVSLIGGGIEIRYIEDVAVIQPFEDEKEATRALVRSTDDILVYHTGKEKIEIQIKHIFGFRGQYDKPRV